MQENYHGRLFMTGILSLIFILVVLLIGVVFVTYRAGGNSQQSTINSQQSSSIPPLISSSPLKPKFHGLFLVHVPNDQTEFSVGDTVDVDIYADSDGHQVVGYDLDLDISGGARFDKAISQVSDFDMHPAPKNGGVYLTSLKNLTSTTPTIFTDTPIATVSLTFTKPGTVMITPQFMVGDTSHSNLMDTNSESVLGSVEGITLTVR